MKQMTRLIIVRLPRDLVRRARRKAAARVRTLDALVEEGLRLVLKRKREAATPKRVVPRVSTARGGLRPGMENLTFSQLEELGDLEYVARTKRMTL